MRAFLNFFIFWRNVGVTWWSIFWFTAWDRKRPLEAVHAAFELTAQWMQAYAQFNHERRELDIKDEWLG